MLSFETWKISLNFAELKLYWIINSDKCNSSKYKYYSSSDISNLRPFWQLNHTTHQLFFFFFRYILYKYFNSLVSWGCRMRRLHFCRRVRHPRPTSVLDMTPNNLMVKLQHYWNFRECRVLHGIAPRSTLTWSGSTW